MKAAARSRRDRIRAQLADLKNTNVEGFPEGSRMRSKERQVVVGRAYSLAGSLSGGRALS